MIKDCKTREDLRQLLQNSHDGPVFLLKHSTRCPISGAAWRAYQAFDRSAPSAQLWKVLVIEDRALSAEIAREVGIVHKSPQALLLRGGEVTWHTSHYSITEQALEDALHEGADN